MSDKESKFKNIKIETKRQRRLRNIATSIEMELLDIIMDEYEDMGLKEIPSIGLALGVYSVTMQFTSEIVKHTLKLMIDAQGEAETLPISWRYKKNE